MDTSGLTDFLELSYEELEERNLDVKADRKNNTPRERIREKLVKILREEKAVKAVIVCFTDIEGKFVRLDYNKDFLLEAEDNLSFDGSSIRGFTSQATSDLRLKVDWSSLRWLPADIFGPGKVLMFANVCDLEGNQFPADFRGALMKLQDDLYKKESIVPNACTEVEGILLEGLDAEQNFHQEEGFKLVTTGGYFNALPQDELRQFIDYFAEAQKALGFENEKDHPEVAPSQFELNYKYTNMLEAADNVQLYKLIARQVAKNMGYTATFLPKPLMNLNGNGMHTNISLSKDDKNIFYDAKGKDKLSEVAHDFLTSILYHAKDICMVLSSTVNAYRRLDPNYEAPNEIKFSAVDRSSMIRIPFGNERSARIEVRSVAPDCNPYLEMYTLLKTGLKGVNASPAEKKEFATVHQRREKLPSNIHDSLRYFKRSNWVSEMLGEENKKKYSDLKEETADRSPKDLGTLVKRSEVIFHHEVSNQHLWNQF